MHLATRPGCHRLARRVFHYLLGPSRPPPYLHPTITGDLVTRTKGTACEEDPCHTLVPDIVDLNAWHRYCTLLSVFKVYGKTPWISLS